MSATITRVPTERQPGGSVEPAHWRLVTWTKVGDEERVSNVVSSKTWRTVVSQSGWATEWFQTEVDRAIRALGWYNVEPANGDETEAERTKRLNSLGKVMVDGNRWHESSYSLVIHSNRFEATERATGIVLIWHRARGRAGEWSVK